MDLRLHLQTWRKCKKCPLHKYRQKTCLLHGKKNRAKILFIGDYPQPQDDTAGEPFSGEMGDILYELVRSANLLDLGYVGTNLVACHPDTDTGIRNPKQSEILKCWPRVLEILRHYKPRIIVTVSPFAEKTMGMVKDDLEFDGVKPVWAQITHPAMILKAGGVASVAYSYSVTALKSASSKLQWEDRLNGSV